MFLLFDKVYVKYDFLMENDQENLVITPNIVNLMFDELALIHSGRATQIANVDTVADLIDYTNGLFGSDKGLFQTLLDKGKCCVIVDRNSYDELFIRFVKMMYTDMTSAIAWKVYNTFTTNSQLLKTTSFIWGSAGGEQSQIENAANITTLTKAQFVTKWDSISLDLEASEYNSLRFAIHQKMGVEWLIANRLASGLDLDATLGTKMYSLVGSRVNEEVQFLRSHLFNNIYKGWSQTVLGIDPITAEDSLLDSDFVNSSDKIRWLMDDTEKFHTPEYTSSHPNIKYSSIRSDIMTAVTGSATPFEENLTDSAMDTIYDNRSTQTLDATAITSIINHELQPLTTSVFESEDRLKVNVMFLNHIYQLKNSNDVELNAFRL